MHRPPGRCLKVKVKVKAKGTTVKQIKGADFSIDNPIREEFLGKLLVIEPLEFEKDVHTVHGTADAIRCNIYVVRSADGTKFESFEDSLVFARAMLRVLKADIGKIVVGRLTQGDAKRGQDPPWLLATPDDKDLRAANGLVMALNVSTPADDGKSDDSDGFDEPAAGVTPDAPDTDAF